MSSRKVGEVPAAWIEEAKSNQQQQLFLALRYPWSTYAKDQLPKALIADRTRYDALEGLWEIRQDIGTLKGHPAFRDAVKKYHETNSAEGRDQGELFTMVHGFRGLLLGEKADALQSLAQSVRKYYLNGGHEGTQKIWGPEIETVLELDPAARILDEFAEDLATGKQPGWAFARWLLQLRRGKDPGEFPAESYSEVLGRQEPLDLLFGLARSGKQATPYLAKLRTPFVLMNHNDIGLPISGDAGAAAVPLTLLGILDRIEWLSRGLPAPHLILEQKRNEGAGANRRE